MNATRYQNVYTFLSKQLKLNSESKTCHVKKSEVISFKIVTAHKLFVLHNNHPFNRNWKQSFAQVQNVSATLFFSPVSTVAGGSFCTAVKIDSR